MWRFSANLTTLWTDRPFERRIAAASEAGFRLIECAYPYAFDPVVLRRAADAAGVAWCMINLPSGDAARGERGLACRPERAAAFEASIADGIRYAEALGARRLTCMVGRREPGEDPAQLWHTAVERLRWATTHLAERGVTLQIEALNPVDAPGFLVTRPGEALALVEAIGHANVRVQFDAYHALRTEPDVISALRSCAERLGHVHLADLPDRSAPGSGALPLTGVLDTLDDLGYAGAVGLEYALADGDASAFAWLERWRRHLGR